MKSIFARRVPLYAVLLTVLSVGLSGYAVALTITARVQTFSAIEAGRVIVTGSFTVADDDPLIFFNFPAPAAGTSAGSPVAIPSTAVCGGIIATQGVTSGNWVFILRLFTTASTPASRTFLILLDTTEGSAVLFAATGATVVPNACVIVALDMGTSWDAPLTWELRVV